MNEEDTTPVDLSAVHADDRLIEALRTDGYVTTQTDAEYQLASLLAGWRIETGSAPLPAGPTLDEVEAEIERASVRQVHNRRMRRLQVVSGAAAVVAIVIGGLSIAAHDAAPGSALWGVKQVMFSKAAAETTNMAAAQDVASSATSAINRGDRQSAMQYLNSLQDKLTKIRDDDHRQQIESQIDSLRSRIDQQIPPSSTIPPITSTTIPWTLLQRTPTQTLQDRPEKTLPQIPTPTIPPTVTLPSIPPTVTLPSTVTIPTTIATVPTTVTVPTIPTIVQVPPPIGGGAIPEVSPKIY